MATKKKAAPKSMSAEHKQALAIGREQGRSVRRYLEALDAHKPKRGRKRTPESIQRRLDAIEERLVSADPLSRLQLVQERMDLELELSTKANAVDLSALEDDFVQAAREYGERKGISYAAWREAGVDAAVLKRAGVRRGGGD
ncbi:MAG TPA: hypothetical protein VFA94_02535 [Acidimicrobiales bacterium]|nr:hypothetical protein [Acidimicrobiales bacterium]